MARPRNIKKLFASLKLTPSEAAEMRELLKEDPRIAELRQQREAIEAEIAKLEGTTKPAKTKRGRKPSAAIAVVANAEPKRRGRKPKAMVEAPAEAPKRRGRKPVAKPDTIIGEAPKRRGRPAKTAAVKADKAPVKPATSEKRLAALAKAREARAAKRAVAAE